MYQTFLIAALAVHAPARADAPAHPEWAVVRLPSHGASATIIETASGRSLLLSCAHAFPGSDAHKPIHVDMPRQDAGRPKKVRILLRAVDHSLDLSLIEVEDGPMPYCCPVAPDGHKPSDQLMSVGYDDMRWPQTQRKATIAGTQSDITFTRERPWHGRSGGALIDVNHNCLVGVVSGYETSGPRFGIYVSHSAIVRFLRGRQPRPQPARPAPPERRPEPDMDAWPPFAQPRPWRYPTPQPNIRRHCPT